MSQTTGALVLGANLNGLTIARSLGRRGIPVWLATPSAIKLASYSRYACRTLPWPDGEPEIQAEYLLDIAARHKIAGWILYPTSDESAALLSRFHSILSSRYRISVPSWESLRWAYDKRLTYELAAQEQVDHPFTLYPATETDLTQAGDHFPAILKPAVHASANRFIKDKAWLVRSPEELLTRYREARELVPSDQILLQELIPGGGEAQFSYAALCRDGQTIASLTARRTRQYPVDFGYSSSFVETIPVPEILGPSMQLLKIIRYSGLVEIEYKYDARDRRYKLLDINPRLWTWSALGQAAGVDFPYLLWRMMMGERVPRQTGQVGVRWMRASTDVPAAIHEMFRGRLNLATYLSCFHSPLQFALMAADDPVPAFMDLPLFVYKNAYTLTKNLLTRVPVKPVSVESKS